MRIAAVLEAFSKRYSVYMLLVNLFRKRQFNNDMSVIERCCRSYCIVDPHLQLAGNDYPFKSLQFDAIHVCRLSAIRFAAPYLRDSPQALKTLDCDDYESQTRTQFAAHALSQREYTMANLNKDASTTFWDIESEVIPRFNHIYLSNDADRKELATRFGSATVSILPNCVFVDRISTMQCASPSEATLLFVGTMDYYPNVDGILYFCEHILPEIRQRFNGKQLRLRVVGARPEQAVLNLAKEPDIEVTGEVVSLDPYYNSSDVVIAPLRIGGGTRMKILEAFAYSKATISTTVACSGLDVRDGDQLLIENSPQHFARSCVKLLEDLDRRKELGLRARRWVKDHHDVSVLESYLFDQ